MSIKFLFSIIAIAMFLGLVGMTINNVLTGLAEQQQSGKQIVASLKR